MKWCLWADYPTWQAFVRHIFLKMFLLKWNIGLGGRPGFKWIQSDDRYWDEAMKLWEIRFWRNPT